MLKDSKGGIVKVEIETSGPDLTPTIYQNVDNTITSLKINGHNIYTFCKYLKTDQSPNFLTLKNFFEENVVWNIDDTELERFETVSQRGGAYKKDYSLNLEPFLETLVIINTSHGQDIDSQDRITELVLKYKEAFASYEINSVMDLKLLFTIIFIDRGVKYLTVCEWLEKKYLSSFYNDDYKEFFTKCFIFQNREKYRVPDSAIFSEIDTNGYDLYLSERNYGTRIQNLPLKTKVYRDFIETLNFGQIEKLCNQKLGAKNAEAAITESKEIILMDSISDVDLVIRMNDAWSNISKRLVAQGFVNPGYLCEYYKNFAIHYQKYETMGFMNDWNTDFEDFDEFQEIMSKFFHGSLKTWCFNTNSSDLIIGKLRKSMTSEEIYMLVKEVVEYSGEVKTENWLDFAKNFSEYEKMPVSWWSNLTL